MGYGHVEFLLGKREGTNRVCWYVAWGGLGAYRCLDGETCGNEQSVFCVVCVG